MKKLPSFVVPVAVISLFGFIAYFIINNPPEAKRQAPKFTPTVSVETTTIKAVDFPMQINSYGVVKPRTQSSLLPQVSGQIKSISPNFRDGGFFERDEILVTLDNRDYLAEIKVTEASLLSAQQALAEEQARSAQAIEDWQRLGNGKQAPDLVARKPQLMSAQAKVLSAQAALDKAQLALERTEIKAPFAGRILTKKVDLGQVVSSNTNLADLYAVDYIEVRLPIRNNDLAYLSLPESFRYGKRDTNFPEVTLTSTLGSADVWVGNVVRTEGAIDATSKQLYVVAQIDDPYGEGLAGKEPLKIGQYVTAKINGSVLKNVIVVPNKTIYQGSYVYTVANDVLRRQNVNISWQNDKVAIISDGLNDGDILVNTPLGQVNSGTRVKLISEASKNNNQLRLSQEKPKSLNKQASEARTAERKTKQQNKQRGEG